MFYIQLFLLLSWLLVSCIFGLFMCIYRRDFNINRDFARIFSGRVNKIAKLNVRTEGLEHLEKHQPCIYIANHQSGVDMATFGTIFPSNTVLIGKKELALIPLFGWFYKFAGNIMIDRKKTSEAKNILIQTVKKEIQKHNLSIWIFPEGTRNPSGIGLLPFKMGAFHMAISAQIPIVPVLCSSLADTANWSKRRICGGDVTVKVLPAIETKGLTEADAVSLKQKAEDIMREELAIINHFSHPVKSET